MSYQKLPVIFNAIAQFMQCHDFKGKHRFYQATKNKLSSKLIAHRIAGNEFLVPWGQWCFWNNLGPKNYYLEEIIPFVNVVNKELKSFDFFDLGADVGVISALVNKYCKGINKIYAFEPNPISFEILFRNIANISDQHLCQNAAASDFTGQCYLEFDSDVASDHEGHIVIDRPGLTEVTSLDAFIAEQSIVLSDEIVIKIDVEGQELAVLNGAKELIRSSNKVVLLLEIHPDVMNKDNMSPEHLFNTAEAIRDFNWLVPLHHNKLIDRQRPFFSQFPMQQYDLIGIAN